MAGSRPIALRTAAYYAVAATACLLAVQVAVAAATSADVDWRSIAATLVFVALTTAAVYLIVSRARTTERLRADELDALVQELPALIYRVGRDGRILWAGGALLARGRRPRPSTPACSCRRCSRTATHRRRWRPSAGPSAARSRSTSTRPAGASTTFMSSRRARERSRSESTSPTHGGRAESAR